VKVVHALAARAVGVARVHTRRHVEDVAERAARADRRRAQQVAFDGQRLGRHTGRDHRRVAGDGDRFFERADFQLDVDGERAARAHENPFAPERCEARELGAIVNVPGGMFCSR
jgi:hypothetical protein